MVANNYERDFPRTDRFGKYNSDGSMRKERNFDNRNGTLYIGQRFRNRPLRRENRNSSVYDNQYFLEEETGLKLPP